MIKQLILAEADDTSQSCVVKRVGLGDSEEKDLHRLFTR